MQEKVLMLASVASMIDQFNMPNIRLLQNMGYEVHVACNFKEGNTCDAKRLKKLKKTLTNMQVVWHQWDCPRNAAFVNRCWRAYRQLQGILQRHVFAWIHCHSPVGGVLARIAARQQGIRVIYTAHGFHFYRGAPLRNWLLYYPVERLLAGWTDVLITVNQEDYQFARRKLKAGKVCHIPGIGIDVPKYAVDQCLSGEEKRKFCRQYHIPEDALLLLSVGELNRGKNHRMVIAALSALKRKDVYYMICGQGMMYAKLKKYANRMNVSNQIRVPGYQENMPWIYQNADIFVFPSMREGMPVALMEAMAAGLPCIVSDIRGNRELIDDAAKIDQRGDRTCIKPGGIRFSLRKSQQLLDALERLLDDETFRIDCGIHNQEKIKGCDRSAVNKKMKRIYQYLSVQ